ncbi:hypothetical protein V3C99_018663 [Haemonchus contortus]
MGIPTSPSRDKSPKFRDFGREAVAKAMSSLCSSCPLKILVTLAESTIDATCVGHRALDEHADEQGYNRHFKKNANTTNGDKSRSPAHSRNVGFRRSRVR